MLSQRIKSNDLHLTGVLLPIGIACTEETVEDNFGVPCSVEHFLAYTVLYHRHLHLLQQIWHSTSWNKNYLYSSEGTQFQHPQSINESTFVEI
jgi:hypothetical protein